MDPLNNTFFALSDPTRRSILIRLSKSEATVGELAEPFDMSLPAISKHLGVLEQAGLLQRNKDGRLRRCKLNAGPLETAADWIKFYRQFWDAQMDSLEKYLDKNINKKDKRKKT
jgi:DNA-binding transcriptional ArsR family regulator